MNDGRIVNTLPIVNDVVSDASEAVTKCISPDTETRKQLALVHLTIASQIVSRLTVRTLKSTRVPRSAVRNHCHTYTLVYSISVYTSPAQSRRTFNTMLRKLTTTKILVGQGITLSALRTSRRINSLIVRNTVVNRNNTDRIDQLIGRDASKTSAQTISQSAERRQNSASIEGIQVVPINALEALAWVVLVVYLTICDALETITSHDAISTYTTCACSTRVCSSAKSRKVLALASCCQVVSVNTSDANSIVRVELLTILDVDHTLSVQQPIPSNAPDASSIRSGNLAVRRQRSTLSLNINIILLRTDLTQSTRININLAPIDLNIAFTR